MDNATPYVITLSAVKPRAITLDPRDPGSRYKARQLQIQVVGKSKMIKTVLVNILDVAKDMLVPPNYIGTFMGYVIGAQAKWDPKQPERQQAYLSGEHDPKDLSKIMAQFISEVLSCPTCGLPELSLAADKKEVLGTCRACSFKGPLNISDEKFKRYVINHPPNNNKGDAFSGNKVSKKDTKKNPKEKADKGSSEEEKIEEKPEKAEPKKEKKASTSSKKEDDEEEVVWYTDTSEEAAKKRREAALPEGMLDKLEKIDNSNGAPKAEQEDDDLDFEAVQKLVKEGNAEVLLKYKAANSISDRSFIKDLFPLLFPSSDVISDVKKNKALLSKLIASADSQKSLLSCLERFCGKAGISPNTLPLVFKEFYDQDLVTEEVLLAWYNKTTSTSVQAVRKALAPFIKWLQEAEEESEDDEDEGEEEDSD